MWNIKPIRQSTMFVCLTDIVWSIYWWNKVCILALLRMYHKCVHRCDQIPNSSNKLQCPFLIIVNSVEFYFFQETVSQLPGLLFFFLINQLFVPTHLSSLGLADAVHSADGLQLMCWVENGLHKQHMGSLDNVQAIWPCVQRQQQDVDLLFIFERTQVLLREN